MTRWRLTRRGWIALAVIYVAVLALAEFLTRDWCWYGCHY